MKIKSAVLAACSVAALTAGTQLPAANAAPYCGIYWGSLAKSDRDMAGGELVNVRAGRHACYDRMVVDVEGDISGYDVRYVKQVTQDGSGHVVPVAGGARLQVIARVPAYDEDGATYDPADPSRLVNVTGYRTFKQVAFAGSFEGQTTLGLGVRARLPFRVFILDGPGDNSRLVIDVAHQW